MFSEALRDICRPSYAEILAALKRSDGMAISELSKELRMSYMGVKQHCVNLEKKGYLETWRVPRTQVGRPEKLYRLTSKCDPLFPEAGTDLTLNVLKGVQKLYGESAPEKMLLNHFETLRTEWTRKISGAKSLAEKVTLLTELRDGTGAFSRCRFDAENGLRMEEYHNPLQPIFQDYPNAVRMEIHMMEQLLGTRVVRREVSSGKGRRHIVYEVATLASAPEQATSIDRRSLVSNRTATAPNTAMRPAPQELERPVAKETANQTFLEG